MQCETLHSGSRDFTNRFSRKHGAPLELGIVLPTSRTDREPRKLLLTESRFSWDPATSQEAQTLLDLFSSSCQARRVATEPVHLGQEAFLDLQAAWQRERSSAQ